MLELLTNPAAWASLLTLTLLEVVLGVDNVIFLSIVTSRLPAHQQPRARRIGLLLALLGRVVLLFALGWLIGLTAPILNLVGIELSWRDIMVAAVVISIGVMLVAAEPLSAFVHKHPTVKMLALSFLMLIGVALIADGFEFHIPRGYLYFGVAFATAIEILNLVARKHRSEKPPKKTA